MQIFADKIFENPIKIIQAFDNKSFIEAFKKIEILKKTYYLLGYIRYEAKEIFLGKDIESKWPLLYFEVYEDVRTQKLKEVKSPQTYTYQIHPKTIDYQKYKEAIAKIKEAIACGNTYQVNYTYDYKIEIDMDGFNLYNKILPNQITPYNSYIKNKYEEILCFSPELFFELKRVSDVTKIRTKPMKGTMKKGSSPKEDAINVEFLRNDIKNRAENVMIVDLLRNDLGKIAKTGSVKTDKLFEIETYNTLHQMTSEVSAELEEGITLYDIFEAIFPCGSITGAPKINTMNIIDELEIGSREVYCGAIGLISPEKTIFSVPIRILQKKNTQDFFSCRVGGAIVWDSTPEGEWEETLTKIKFLNNVTKIEQDCYFANIKLIETISVKDGKMQYKDEHFERMKKSAEALKFSFNFKSLDLKVKPAQVGMFRVLLSQDGGFEIQELPLERIRTNKVIISRTPINSKEPMLYHKTTYRPWYSMEKIKTGAIFDEIFFNEKGELTEGARSNIILQIEDGFFTPPVECGILNGIMRQKMLRENKLKEKILYLSDLKKAEKVFCINSVRGIVEVEVDFNRQL